MNTNNAKQNILEKLSSAKKVKNKNASPTSAYTWPKLPNPINQFISLLKQNHASVIQCNEKDIEQKIRTFLNVNSYRNAIASDRILKKYPALNNVAGSLPSGDIENWKEYIFNDVDVGITNAYAGIATTGSIVLSPGADEPRSLSLVPTCHIVVIQQSTFYNDFNTFIQSQNWPTGMPTNIVLVSGPSKTADIQQTLAYGAHGPRELHVIVVE